MNAGFAHIKKETASSGIPEAARHRSDLDPILGDLLQSVFFVSIIQSKLVYVTKIAGFLTAFLKTESQRNYRDKCLNYLWTVC